MILLGWLREVCKSGADYNPLINCRHNRSSPNFGVYVEYPLIEGFNIDKGEHMAVWDECFCYENEDGSLMHTLPNEYMNEPPPYSILMEHNLRPKAIVDVVGIHKGVHSIAIEVVHRHPTPEWKVELVCDVFYGSVVEISADWILNQIETPKKLKYSTVYKS